MLLRGVSETETERMDGEKKSQIIESYVKVVERNLLD